MSDQPQGELFPDAWEYRVVINSSRTYYACTIDEAWKIIGQQPFGSCHMVYDKQGHLPDEFIPY